MKNPDVHSAVGRRPRPDAAWILCAVTATMLATLAAPPAAAAPNQHVTLVGAIEALPAGPGLAGEWTVAGQAVHVAAGTPIDQSKAPAVVGATVQVKGKPRADRSLDASEIRVLRAPMPRPRPRPVELAGTVAALPDGPPFVGDWLVDGTTVHVTEATRVDERIAPVAVGAFVLVRGARREDGSLDAASIEVRRAAPRPRMCDFAVLHLTAAEGSPAGAEGVVLTRVVVLPNGTERQDLKLSVENLLAETAYDVVIDDVNAGVILTDAEGDGHLFLSDADIPGAEPLPAELSPVFERAHAEVQVAGAAVLAGDFADARRHGCGQARPDAMALAVLLDADGTPRGVAIVAVKGDVQTFRLAAWTLPPGVAFGLFADGIALATVTAGPDGAAQVVLSSLPGAGQLPLPAEALPVGDLVHVELRAGDGSVLAAGDLVPAPGV